jgi:hypothetical protein
MVRKKCGVATCCLWTRIGRLGTFSALSGAGGGMPTELTAILASASDAQAARQNNVSVLLICCAMALANLALLFVWPNFAEALALVGSY